VRIPVATVFRKIQATFVAWNSSKVFDQAFKSRHPVPVPFHNSIPLARFSSHPPTADSILLNQPTDRNFEFASTPTQFLKPEHSSTAHVIGHRATTMDGTDEIPAATRFASNSVILRAMGEQVSLPSNKPGFANALMLIV
jgi:hypothetical protein